MKCPSCAVKVNDSVEQCPSCGFRLEKIGDKIDFLPRKRGWFIDAADIVDEESGNRIYHHLLHFHEKTGIEFYVVTIPTSGKVTPREYVFYFLNHYALGGKDHRGLVLMLFLKEKTVACEVGYSLENRLTDENANDVLLRDAAPLCASGQYGKALYAATALLADALRFGRSRLKRFLRRNFSVIGRGGA